MGSTFSLVLGLVNGLPRLNITQGISDTVTSSSNYQQIRIAITIFKKVIVYTGNETVNFHKANDKNNQAFSYFIKNALPVSRLHKKI